MPIPTPPPPSCSVEALAEWLRFVTVTRIQKREPETLRPFAESGGREGWLACAQDLRALLDAKVREAVCDADLHDTLDEDIADHIVARVLGAP